MVYINIVANLWNLTIQGYQFKVFKTVYFNAVNPQFTRCFTIRSIFRVIEIRKGVPIS